VLRFAYFTLSLTIHLKKPTITDPIRLYRLWWLGHVQRMEEREFPK
jgi:hypothetical protein